MKKKRFASILLVAPLMLFAACSSTPKLVLEANWFVNPSVSDILDDFEETLEYEVSFEKSASAANGRFTMDYPNGGTYSVKFEDGTKDGKKTYVYSTELKMQVRYTLDGVSTELMEDVVTTRVEFLNIQNNLQPLSSTRTAKVTAPLASPTSAPDSLDVAYGKYNYCTEITYDVEKEEAEFKLTNLADGASETKTIDFDGSGMFFDNEQLIPVLRAAELSSSMSLRTLDPTTRTLEKISIKDGPTATTLKQSVKIGDEEKKEYEFQASEISIAYNKQNAGATQKFIFAQRSNRNSNPYRNVLLKYEYPVIYSHGVLTYTLTTANFYG